EGHCSPFRNGAACELPQRIVAATMGDCQPFATLDWMPPHLSGLTTQHQKSSASGDSPCRACDRLKVATTRESRWERIRTSAIGSGNDGSLQSSGAIRRSTAGDGQKTSDTCLRW